MPAIGELKVSQYEPIYDFFLAQAIEKTSNQAVFARSEGTWQLFFLSTLRSSQPFAIIKAR